MILGISADVIKMKKMTKISSSLMFNILDTKAVKLILLVLTLNPCPKLGVLAMEYFDLILVLIKYEQ